MTKNTTPKIEFSPKNKALSNSRVTVLKHQIAGKEAFEERYYKALAVMLGYSEKAADKVFRYLADNVTDGDRVIVTTKKLSEEFETSQTWIASIFSRMKQDKFISKEANGIWKVSKHFLKLMEVPYKKAEIVVSFEEVPDQLSIFDNAEEHTQNS